jgi:hypothetical protein
MNIRNPDHDDLLRSLALYWLFKNANTLDAYALSERIGLNDELELKRWLQRGCKVHWAWLEKHVELSHVLMSQQSFGMLIAKDKRLHATMKISRDAASRRWSNDWKNISVKINTAQSLSMVKPTEKELDMAWSAATSTCASLLHKVGHPELSSQMSQLASCLR